MDNKELKDESVYIRLPQSLLKKIKRMADEDYEGNFSMAARQCINDYFLTHPEKGIESK